MVNANLCTTFSILMKSGFLKKIVETYYVAEFEENLNAAHVTPAI
jgi:hypothetical protein